MKRLLSALSIGALVALAPAATASASELDVLTVNQEQQLVETFESRGSSHDAAVALVERIDAGYLPDSDRGDVDPIDVEVLSDDSVLQRYPDGSSSVVSLEAVATGERATSLGGCASKGSSGYYASYIDCRVRYSGSTMIYSFVSSFSLSPGGGVISSAYSPVIERAWGYTVSDVNVSIIRTRSGAQPALAQMTFLGTKTAGGWDVSTKTFGLSLRVYSNRYEIGG